MEKEIGFIIQARSGSTRMPGKILHELSGGRCILEIIIQNIKNAFPDIPLILATTDTKNDDETAELGRQLKIKVFRGDENNVAMRFLGAAQEYGISTIIRVCADNPFLNMDAINELLTHYKNNTSLDYLSFCTSEGIPVIRSHFGLFVEIIKTATLIKTMEETEESFYLEHVTNYAYGHPDKFKIELISLPESISSRTDLRFTIDDRDDYRICQQISEELKDDALNIDKLVSYVDRVKLTEHMLKQIEKYKK